MLRGVYPESHRRTQHNIRLISSYCDTVSLWEKIRMRALPEGVKEKAKEFNDVELIVMSPTLAAAAIAQSDIDYVAGVGPASVAATLTGLPSRAIGFRRTEYRTGFSQRCSTRRSRNSRARRSPSREESAAQTMWRYPSRWRSPAPTQKIS